MTTKTKAMENNATVVGIVRGNELIPESQINLYNQAMDNVRAFSTSKSRKNNVGIVAINLSLLYVDERYQGLRSHNKINRLIKNWDEDKLSPITVVPHPEEYRFAVVDGQGRLMAARQKGEYDSLQAIVLLKEHNSIEERLKFEAKIFAEQDLEVEKIRPEEKHLANVIAGDEPAVILDNLLHKYEISIKAGKGSKGKSILGSYTDTYSVAKVQGEKCLDFIFSIIENVGWNYEKNGYATFVIRALKNIWIAHPEDRVDIYCFLSKELRKIDPTLLSANSRSKYPERDFRISCSLYVEDLVCDTLHLEKRIYEDKNRCKIIA